MLGLFLRHSTRFSLPRLRTCTSRFGSGYQLSRISEPQDDSNVWLITGASSGFGKRFVLSVLSRGDRVIATARSLEKLNGITSLLKPELSQRLRVSQLDITEGEEQIKGKIAAMASFWGRIDILVNNAGLVLPALIEEGGTRLLRRQFETNVFGALDVANATLPFIRESKSGCVVTIGSRSAWRAEIPGMGHYAASKAAIHAVTEALTAELAQFNIKVLLVEPGGFRTEGSGIYGQAYFTQNPLTEYDTMRGASKTRFESIAGTEKGDPDKAVEVIVDAVRGEGVAKGRPWPRYLILGEDAEVDLRTKCKKVLDVLDEWVDVTRSVSFDRAAGIATGTFSQEIAFAGPSVRGPSKRTRTRCMVT